MCRWVISQEISLKALEREIRPYFYVNIYDFNQKALYIFEFMFYNKFNELCHKTIILRQNKKIKRWLMKDYPLILIDFLDYIETIKGHSSSTTKEYGYSISCFLK